MSSVSGLILLASLILSTPPQPPPRDVTMLTEKIKQHPDSPYLFLCRGEGFLLKGDPDKAVLDFDEAIRLDPKTLEYFDAKVRALEAKRDYPRVLEVLTSMTNRFPDTVSVYRRRAKVQATFKKDIDAAIADLTRSIELNAKVPEIFEERGDLYAEKKQYDKALADFDQSISLNSQEHQLENGFPQKADQRMGCHGYLRRGDVWLVRQDYGKAIEEYKKALGCLSYFLPAKERIAWIQVSCPDAQFRNGQAAQFFAKLHYHPGMFPKTDGRPYTLRAAAHAELGEFKDAVEWEKQAIEAAKDDPAFLAGAKERLALYLTEKPYRWNGTDTLVLPRRLPQ